VRTMAVEPDIPPHLLKLGKLAQVDCRRVAQ